MRNHRPSQSGTHQFPCGHKVAADAVRMRVSHERHAAWARCPRCGVIVVLVEPPGDRERWSRRGA
jgi:hypothetical protein